MAALSGDVSVGAVDAGFCASTAADSLLRRAVIDLGTGSLKVGWSGERRPRHCLVTCSGAVRRRPQLFVSEECLLLPEYICSRPASGGLWSDLDVLRDIIDLSLSKRFLGADPETLGVTVTQPILAPAATRRQLYEVFFEDFGVQRLAVCAAQALVPYAFWSFDGGSDDLTATPSSKQGSKQPLHLQKMRISCYSGEGGHSNATEKRDPCLSPPSSGGTSTGSASSNSAVTWKGRSPRNSEGACQTLDDELAASGLAWVDKRRNPFSLVVDCGFSCSHAVPCTGYTAMEGAALRSEVAGACANAYLKNLLAARGICLEKKELFVQKVKEEVCFVVSDLPDTLQKLQTQAALRGLPAKAASFPLEVWRPLPDYTQTKAQLLSFFHSHSPAPIPDLNRPEFRRATFGEKTDTVCADTAEKGEAAEVSDSNKTQRSVQGEEACETSTPRECSANMQSSSSSSERALLPRPGVRVAAERIVVPEVLFRPQDAESSECGLPELICRAIAKAPVEAQPFLASQIFLTGGSSKFPGFTERLWRDLRASLPQDWPVNIYRHEDPQLSAWLGASVWTERDSAFLPFSTTKEQFFESGIF